MTDLHTHILPGMDDGSRSFEMSIAMLREEAAQGVSTVALTPHYYRERESSGSFLERRFAAYTVLEEAISTLPETERAALPARVLAAEVAWVPNLADCSHLRELCYQGTDVFLLELPMQPWYDGLFSQLYDLMNLTGLTPMIAHIDRYWTSQKPTRLAELYSLGLPTQLSAAALLRFSTRSRALKELQAGRVQYLMSDCHRIQERKPNILQGMETIEKRLGAASRRRLETMTDSLLADYAQTLDPVVLHT
ncbi:MAG: hypothetical protein K6G66_08135 [Oscillospiraceae bacterium]|nr:hypothetical protein [Oscillospiraceae bacterium]